MKIIFFFGIFLTINVGCTTLDSLSYAQALNLIPDAKIDSSVRRLLKETKYRNSFWAIEKIKCSQVLGMMGYGTGPFLSKFGNKEYQAILKFQKDFAIPRSGELDSETINILNIVRTEFDKKKDIEFPYKRVIIDSSDIIVQGSWAPLNSVKSMKRYIEVKNFEKINCRLTDKICKSELLEIDSSNTLRISSNNYDITSQDSETVVMEKKHTCVTELIIFTKKLKKVQMLRSKTNNDNKCNWVENITQISDLVDWRDISKNIHKNGDFYSKAMSKNSDLNEIINNIEKSEK